VSAASSVDSSAEPVAEKHPLEERLGHVFFDRRLLITAITHKSFVYERTSSRPPPHNERLEFLGDSVLGLLVTHLLMEACPDSSEGSLSLLRSRLINEASLCELSRDLDLGGFLLLGRGEEQSGGRQKPSLLADAYEAVFGALYLDGGFAVAAAAARRLLGNAISRVLEQRAPDQKSALQELLQRQKQLRPRYEVVATSGPEHDKTFEVAVFLEDRQLAQASGRSKRAAEQAAAELALSILVAEEV
jgi:ribonuclease-3